MIELGDKMTFKLVRVFRRQVNKLLPDLSYDVTYHRIVIPLAEIEHQVTNNIGRTILEQYDD